ncbi:hypothetical protein AL036_21850 [Salipiger aestuarii]|uniref:DUF192 domain-containing protein n=1 Tax=Salipiger aestuarii TaxID=568098 RepID=A0A327XFX4_9RHOB|nr:DUF192 domain-containing protein [Salipiger aestuarii]EIE51425.1 hypothetical protein C357_08945 [Citreicella sp. 357]KAA8604323.1 hypothetical protein AL036_21850 [Salipiger aestuarii]KAB2531882.1 hypothetical protein AL035_21310 [Salipiger aestuarii]RAK07680.1 hypothetical protein ATI53_10953 [Salipiger aestuarii]
MGSRTFALLTVVAAVTAAPLRAAECRDDTLWLRGDWGSARFRVSVADDAQERAEGLMNVRQMPGATGMLFAYEREQPVAFWMKNTFLPLDMIFADSSGRVLKVHRDAVPHDQTPIPSGQPVQYVLEINAGLSRQLGIAPGSVMQHPAIETPAWPCE